MIRAKAARKAYAAIARARLRRRHDDMMDSIGHLTGLFARMRKANAASLVSLKDLARQMRTYPVRPFSHPARGLQLAGATVSYRAPDDTLQALGVICPGFTIEDDVDLASETATQVHERLERQYRLQREELAARPAPKGYQWVPGDFGFNCAGEARQGPPMLRLVPWPCSFCLREPGPSRNPEPAPRLVPAGRITTCSLCRAAGAPDYLP